MTTEGSWYLVKRTDWLVQDQFEAIWMQYGGPRDAALFAVPDFSTKSRSFYFNPAAAQLAADLIDAYGAVPCEPLDVSHLDPFRGPVLLVGDQSIVDGLD
jgi:hypothetical protein